MRPLIKLEPLDFYLSRKTPADNQQIARQKYLATKRKESFISLANLTDTKIDFLCREEEASVDADGSNPHILRMFDDSRFHLRLPNYEAQRLRACN